MNDLQKIENLFQEGLTYFRSGEYFEAHESWEELWSDFYLKDRRFVQGLIQLSVSFVHLENNNLNLKPNDPLLYFMQRLRDEAHRFAITAHRARRSKTTVKSIFDEIKGIGPKRKKELLLHFGTIEKIKSASLEELKKIKSIPAKKLQELFEFFNG